MPSESGDGVGRGRRSPAARQRIWLAAALLALLVLGAVIGIGAARWRAAAPGPQVAAPATPQTAPAAALPPARAAARGPASPPVPPAPAGVAQLEIADLLRAGAPATDWRLARLRSHPQVLVLEFPGLAEQGAAMNRMAAFIEKEGAPRDRVLGDAELDLLIQRQGDNAQTFYQGHDYSADHLANFFSTARRQGQVLNAHETRLLQLLLDSRLLGRQGTDYRALGLQAIVTFTGTQADDWRTPQDETIDARRRASVLMHEISHGLFFTDAAYREHCLRYWRQRLSAGERAAFRRLLASLNYDTRNELLLVNEMQALLMHTPDLRAFAADSLGITETQLANLRMRFRVGMPPR